MIQCSKRPPVLFAAYGFETASHCFEFWSLEIRVCLEFRDSIFGFNLFVSSPEPRTNYEDFLASLAAAPGFEGFMIFKATLDRL